MNVKELTNGIHNCPCGKDHVCPIDFVEIGAGALDKLPTICADYRHILLVADHNTWKVAGESVYSRLENAVEHAFIMEDNGPVVVPNEEKIAEIEACLSTDTDLIIGIGSGVINDLCKHVSFIHGIRYVIVATAPSMDGYASVGAALTLGDM